MAKYAISPEGTSALKKLSNDLLINVNNVVESVQELERITESLYDDLGIYGDEILNIIQQNKKNLSENREDIVNLARRVSKQANEISNLIALWGVGTTITSMSSLSFHADDSSILGGRYASQEEKPKILTRNEEEAVACGMRAIDDQMEAVRDDLRDKGYTDLDYIESIVTEKRETAEIEFYNDLYGTIEDKAIASLQRLASYFTESGWNALSYDEKKDALNTLAVDAGDAYRTEIKGVVFFDGPPSKRGHYNRDGYLHINSDCLRDTTKRLDAINTVYHEGRHAYQYAAINNPSKYGITSERAQIWQDNFNNYLSSIKFGYERYFTQPVEADAFEFADFVVGNGGIS